MTGKQPAQKSGEAIPVPARLVRPHPMVAKTQAIAKRIKPVDGMMIVNGNHPGAFELRASADQLGRALRILQAICNEATRRGYAIEPGPAGGGFLVVGKHRVMIRVTERWRQSDNPRYDPSDSLFGGPAYLHEPSGELRIQLPRASSTTSEWRDGKRKKVESKLAKVFLGIEAAAAYSDEIEQRNQQLSTHFFDQARVRIQEQQERELQKRRVVIVRERAEGLRVAKEVRQLIDALAGRPIDEDSARWIEWAKQYADSVDPLMASQTFPPFSDDV